MLRTVLMHFGDGTFKEILIDTELGTSKEDVEQEAKSYVLDNMWFDCEEMDGDA